MSRMENKAVSDEKGSPPQDESGSGNMKIADLFRMLCELIDSRFGIAYTEQRGKIMEL